MSKTFRINIENADLVVNEVGSLIDVAKIYGSGRLMESMLESLKDEYMREVGQSQYQSGIGINDSRNLMSKVGVEVVNGDRRQLKVKNGATIIQGEGHSPKAVGDVAEILHLIQKGWKAPSQRKVFRLAPDRAHSGVMKGGYMVVTAQKPKPFVINTVKQYTKPGKTNAGTILDKEMAKKLRRY